MIDLANRMDAVIHAALLSQGRGLMIGILASILPKW